MRRSSPRRPLVKTRNKAYLEELKYADMPKVLKAVNAAQDTAWRINEPVLKLITELAKRDSELGGVPRATHYAIPEKPKDIDSNEESRKKYRARARSIHEANVNLTSQRISFLTVLETAKKYAEYDEFFCPAQLDFRGRVYFMPQLNPQGPDWIKGLLEFSDGVALGDYGLEWLKVHIANLFGVDKVSYSERVAWVDENTEMLCAIADDPYDNLQWAEADKPFQAYAACFDLDLALGSENPEEYISRIPIALDGSCSGIQQLSMAFRDTVGGAAVNILPSDKPSDIYQLVADATLAVLKELSAQIEPVAQSTQDGEKEVTPIAALAQWWLDFGITRKHTKRNCMTFPYGSKQRGFSDQILEDILNPHIKEHGDLKFNPMLLSNLLAKINYQSVKQIVLKASEAMDWMQQAARMVAKEGRPVCWTTPLGFPVVQNYLCTKEARVETSLAGERNSRVVLYNCVSVGVFQ